MFRLIIAISGLLLALSACESGESGDSGEATGTTGEATGTTGEWTEMSVPCGAIAVWFDDADNGFMGCGDKADGSGLYITKDGGKTWDLPTKLAPVRVNDLQRGPDGVLYGAGAHTVDKSPVFSFDEEAQTAKGLYPWGNNAYSAVGQGENVVISSDGKMLIDDLTGTSGAVFTGNDVTPWCDGSDKSALNPSPDGTWCELGTLGDDVLDDPAAPAFQVRALASVGSAFYACGSLINDPARVYVPSSKEGATYHFRKVQLQKDTEDGELMDMHAWSDTRMILVGYDNSYKVPLVYMLSGAASDKANWTSVALPLDGEGGANAVAVRGETVVIVGEKFPTAKGGWIIRSTDGGSTWHNVTPATELKIPVMEAVWIFDDGAIYAAGQAAFIIR